MLPRSCSDYQVAGAELKPFPLPATAPATWNRRRQNEAPQRKSKKMYGPTKKSPIARMEAYDRRVWNDALQAAVLALACNEPDPLRPDALIDADPCDDCGRKDCARALIIKRVLALKR